MELEKTNKQTKPGVSISFNSEEQGSLQLCG